MATERKGTSKIKRHSLLAIYELDRLGLNPIEMLAETYKLALEAYKSGRGWNDRGDAGAAYLGVAVKAASDLAKFKHPTLSAVGIKDLDSAEPKETINTAKAVEVLKSDPFAPKEIKEIPTDRIINALNSTIQSPFLPSGRREDLDV